MEMHSLFSRTFKLSLLTTALASISVLTACTSTPQNNKVTTTKTVSSSDLLDSDSLDGLEDLLYATDMRAVESDRLLILRHGDVWKRITVGYGMDLNHFDPRIEAQRSWFTSRQPYIDRLSARASRYIHYTVKEAERRGLPTELALLPIIESSYDPAATSSAAAAGLWQFIPSTGKIYGLRQSDLYDGRRDVVESTRAAYEYLSSLYNQFGSWELALASYNAGPGRIQQAINRNKAAGLPTDYWSLKLPQETMYYVPRFLAVAQIIKNPAAYGVSLPPIANRPHFREVTIPGGIDLDELSRLTGVSRGELYALNPGHRSNYTDPLAPRRMLIPNEVHTSVDNKIAQMTTVSGSGGLWAGGVAPLPTLPAASTSTTTKVTVTPPINARTSSSVLVTNEPSKLPTSGVLTTPPAPAVVAQTKQATPLGSQALANFAARADVPSAPRVPISVSSTTAVKPVTVEPPLTAQEKSSLIASITQETGSTTIQANELVQKITEPAPTDAEKQQIVQELEKIAPKGTEIINPKDGAIQLTALQSSQSIAEQKGEEVKIGFAYPKVLAEATKGSAEAQRNQGKPVVQTSNEVVVVAPKGKREVYTVQAGDTLANIATRFGTTWRAISDWNQIDPTGNLLVGTRLYLYDVKPIVEAAPVQKTIRHTVRAGETLTGIAAQYDLSLQDVAAWNNLTVSSNVLIGQNLTLVEPKNFKETQQKALATQKMQEAEEKAKAEVAKAAESKIETETYIVKGGEFLKLIADRYGLSVTELAALTPNLSISSNLLVGQKIQVPKTKVAQPTPKVTEDKRQDSKKVTFPTMSYTVVSGDYLSTVAQKHKMSLAEIAELNNIKTNTSILVGQKLQVKQIEPARPATYRVQGGDNLTSVADKFDLSIQQLAGMNNLKTDSMLKSGQVLKLDGEIKEAQTSKSEDTQAEKAKAESAKKEDKPEVANSAFKGETESYTVKSGEHLTVLAQRYKLSVSALAALNNLTARSNLRVGQTIKVPKLTTTYKVKRGDTLIGLAKRFDMSVDEFAEMNDLKVDTQVKLGQVLTVPN